MVSQTSILESSSSSNYSLILQKESPTQRWKKMSGNNHRCKVIEIVAFGAIVFLIGAIGLVYGAIMFATYGSKYNDCYIYRGGCNNNPKCIAQEAEGICETETGAIMGLVFGGALLLADAFLIGLQIKCIREVNQLSSRESIISVRKAFMQSAKPQDFINSLEIRWLNTYIECGIFPEERKNEFDAFFKAYNELEIRKNTIEKSQQSSHSYMIVDKDSIQADLGKIAEEERKLNDKWSQFKNQVVEEFPTPFIEEL